MTTVPSLVTVTPEIAADWLKKVSPKQRHKMKRHVEGLADDIKAGRWMLTHQPIAFDTDGYLIDGQHRCEAVVMAGLPIKSWVFYGVDSAVMPYIDRHQRRTIAFRIQCLGLAINHSMAAIARAMVNGPSLDCGKNRIGDFALIDFATEHMEAIHFASSVMPKQFGNAVVKGLIARMWYHVDQHVIERFCLAATDRLNGDETDLDRSVRRCGLRLHADFSGGRGGASTRSAIYRRWQSLAYSACVENRSLSVVRETAEDMFPLPK